MSTYHHQKTERRPLFNPHVDLTLTYGMPNYTDYLESRYISSKDRRNELLQQPTRITPGLNLEMFDESLNVVPAIDQIFKSLVQEANKWC